VAYACIIDENESQYCLRLGEKGFTTIGKRHSIASRPDRRRLYFFSEVEVLEQELAFASAECEKFSRWVETPNYIVIYANDCAQGSYGYTKEKAQRELDRAKVDRVRFAALLEACHE
jgi:hypothetical protein